MRRGVYWDEYGMLIMMMIMMMATTTTAATTTTTIMIMYKQSNASDKYEHKYCYIYPRPHNMFYIIISNRVNNY